MILVTPWKPLVEMSPATVPAHVLIVPHDGMAEYTMVPPPLFALWSSTEQALHCSLFMQNASHAEMALSQSDTLVGQVGALNEASTPILFPEHHSPLGERSISTCVPLVSSTASVTPISVDAVPVAELVEVHAVLPAVLNVATAVPLAMRVTYDRTSIHKGAQRVST